jgi:hypothetical protein
MGAGLGRAVETRRWVRVRRNPRSRAGPLENQNGSGEVKPRGRGGGDWERCACGHIVFGFKVENNRLIENAIYIIYRIHRYFVHTTPDVHTSQSNTVRHDRRRRDARQTQSSAALARTAAPHSSNRRL